MERKNIHDVNNFNWSDIVMYVVHFSTSSFTFLKIYTLSNINNFCYFIFRLVNYQKNAVLECRSVRPAANQTEIPTGIELRQAIGGRLLAYLVPVVKTIDAEVKNSSDFYNNLYIDNILLE